MKGEDHKFTPAKRHDKKSGYWSKNKT
jgi:hypothetical protein